MNLFTEFNMDNIIFSLTSGGSCYSMVGCSNRSRGLIGAEGPFSLTSNTQTIQTLNDGRNSIDGWNVVVICSYFLVTNWHRWLPGTCFIPFWILISGRSISHSSFSSHKPSNSPESPSLKWPVRWTRPWPMISTNLRQPLDRLLHFWPCDLDLWPLTSLMGEVSWWTISAPSRWFQPFSFYRADRQTDRQKHTHTEADDGYAHARLPRKLLPTLNWTMTQIAMAEGGYNVDWLWVGLVRQSVCHIREH